MDRGLSSAYKSPNVSSRYSSYATSDAGSTSSHHSASMGSSKGVPSTFRPSIMSSMKMQEQELRSESPLNSLHQNSSRGFNAFGDYLRNPRSIAPHETQSPHQIRAKMASDSEWAEKKEKILKDLKKVEEEIEKTETAVKLKRIQKKELEDNIANPANPNDKIKEDVNEEEDLEPWQEIYAANRRQAAKSHNKGSAFLNPALTETGLGFRGTLPQMNQPFDSERIQQLKVQMKEHQPRLLAYLSRKKRLEKQRDNIMSKKYDEDLKKWNETTERKMNTIKARAMAQRHRECFEKIFPELKKQRENQERLKRTANRESARSEAEMNEVLESLQANANRMKKMKQQAVVVPRLLDADERRFQVVDTTGRIDDPVELYRHTCKDNPVWTDKEKAAFKREYINHPKQWHIISSLIPGGKKTVSDCVKHYYSSKIQEQYKKHVRASKRKPAPGRHPKKRADPALAQGAEEMQLTTTKTRFGRKTAVWKEEEIEAYKNALREYGEDWEKISEALSRVPKSNRDAEACKNFFKSVGTCRKYKLKDILKEHLAKKVKDEVKAEPEEKFEDKKVKDEPNSPPKGANSSPAQVPGTPPTASQKEGSPVVATAKANSVSPKALELLLPAGVAPPSSSTINKSESPKAASVSSPWTPGKPGSRPTTPVASRVGSAAVSPIVLPVPLNVAAIPSRPSTPSQKPAQLQDIKVPSVEEDKSSIQPVPSSTPAPNLFKPQQSMIGNPSPRTGVPSVLVGLQQQKASQKTPIRGQPGGTPEVLYQQFFSPYSVQQYPASAFIRGVIPSPQQFLSQRIAPRNAVSEAQAPQAQQQSHRVLDFADSSSASSASQSQQSATSQPYSVESLITPRQRIAPKTSDADFPGQRIMPRPEAAEKPPGHSLFRQELYPVQPKVVKPMNECPLQMLAQAAEDDGKAESAKKEKKRKEEAEKRAIEQAKKEKELLEKQLIKQEQERRMEEAMKAEQARQAEIRRQKMEEARLLEEARRIEAEKQEARRREEAAKAKAEAEARQRAIREKQLREAEEQRQRAIKEAERKAAEKRKLEEERKRQQLERERSERAQLQALLEQKRREQKEAEEQKRRKLEEEEAKRRRREKEEREELERQKLQQKQQEEEARKAKEAAELARKLEKEAEEKRNAEAKALLEAKEKEKAKKEALEKAKREALQQIEADERKSIERARREKEREAAKDREAAKVRAAKEAEIAKQMESTKEKADVETDFVNLLYQKPASSNQEVKINIPPSFELKRRNSDTLQAGSSASPVVNFIKDIPGKPPPDSFPKQPPDKEPDKNDDEEAKFPPPEKKARMKSPSPPPTSTPDENIPVERVHTPEMPTEGSTPELPPKEIETPDDSSSKNLREVTKSGDGSQGSASPAAAVSEPIRSPTPAVTPPPAITYGSHLTEAQQQSQTIVKMEPDSEGYGDYGGSNNYDSCGNFLAEETAIIDLLCETSSSEDEEPAYFGSDTPDLTFSPVNEEVIDDEDDDEPLDLLLGKRAEEEASESESEAEAEPVTPEPRTPEPRPSDESDNRIETTQNAETTLTDPEQENESPVPESTNLSCDNNSSAINSPSQLSKNVSRDDSSGEGDDQTSSPRPGKAASDANYVLNLLADAALGNHHPPTTSNETNSPSKENITLTNETHSDDDNSSKTTLAIDDDSEITTRKERSMENEAPTKIGLENVPEEASPMDSKTDPPSVDPAKINTVNESISDWKQKIANIVESDPGVELTQQKLEVCPPDNTSETSITNSEDQLHASSKLSCDEEKNKLLSVENNSDNQLEFQSASELINRNSPVEEFKVPLTPIFVKEKTSLDRPPATISTVQSAANQHKILEQTKGSSVSEDTTPPSLSGALLANNTQEDNRTPALSQVQEPKTASQKTEKPSERVNLEREVTQSKRPANQNASLSDELTVNKTDTMEQLKVDESCLENPKLGLKQQEPGSFELTFSFSESDRESIDSRPGSVLSSPASHRYPQSVASSDAEMPSLEIVPKDLLQTEDEEVSSAENIDPDSLFSRTKKVSETENDADDEKEEDLDDTICADETILEADTTITETSDAFGLKEPEKEESRESEIPEKASAENNEISLSKQTIVIHETHEKVHTTSEKVEIPEKLNPEIKKQEEKDQKEPEQNEQRNTETPSKTNEVDCASSNPDKKSSVVPPPPNTEKDIVPILSPTNSRGEQTQGQPVPKIIRVPPSGLNPGDQVKPAEKSASKVKATKTFMPPVGFTPPFSQTVKRKLNIPDKEQSVPVGPARKKMRVPLSQQPKTITQPRVQINPVTDYSQFVQTNAIYQKPQSRYVKLQPAPPTSSASMASFSEERLQLERQRQLEQLELKHLEERRRLEANFKNAPLRRTSTSPLTIVADTNRQRRVAYSTEQQRVHANPARPSIVQPQLNLRRPVMEQPIRPRLAQNIQNIQPRPPIDPSRTFRPVQQPVAPIPKQQIRCTLDVKLTNKGFQTLSRTTPSPTGSNGQERVQIQRVIRRSHNTSSNSVQSERQPSKSEERPTKLS